MKIIGSANAIGGLADAFRLLQAGRSVVDACLAVTDFVEDDSTDLTVGYGGLPNSAGIVELDAAIMDGQRHRAGAVAALQGIRHPTRVARCVMERTNRVLLAGAGAQEFALGNGFQLAETLSEKARQLWELWLRGRGDDGVFSVPAADSDDFALYESYKPFFHSPPHGTVFVAARDDQGQVACATSTSGHAFKLPGRVGDSPIIGAGLYADHELGACGSVGRGESNMENLTSFAATQRLKDEPPQVAGLQALAQLAHKTPAKLKKDGRLTIDVRLFLLHARGDHAGVCTRGPQQIAVVDRDGARLEPCVEL